MFRCVLCIFIAAAVFTLAMSVVGSAIDSFAGSALTSPSRSPRSQLMRRTHADSPSLQGTGRVSGCFVAYPRIATANFRRCL